VSTTYFTDEYYEAQDPESGEGTLGDKVNVGTWAKLISRHPIW